MAKQSSSTAPGADITSDTSTDLQETGGAAATDTASTAPAADPAPVAKPDAVVVAEAAAPVAAPAAPLALVRKIEDRANEAFATGNNELHAALSALAVDLGAVRSRLLAFDCDVGGDVGGFLSALKENL